MSASPRFCLAVCGLLAMILGTAPAAAQPEQLRLGLPSLSMYTIIPHLAEDLGYFKREGVAVQIVHFEGGAINIKALLARAVDISDVETSLILGAVASGADLRIVGSYAPNLHFGMYATKDIKSLRDLYGKRFAIAGPGGLTHVVILALLKGENLDPNRVQFLAVGGTGARLRALMAGKVDATVGEFSPQVEGDPKLHRLFIVSQRLPQYIAQSIAVYPDTLETKRTSIERFQVAMVKATRWAYSNKKAFLEAASKHLPGGEADLGQVYDFYVKARIWAINGELDPERVAYIQQLGLEMKTQSAAVDLARLLRKDLADRVAEKLGRVEYP